MPAALTRSEHGQVSGTDRHRGFDRPSRRRDGPGVARGRQGTESGRHAAAVLSLWDAGPEPTDQQKAWLATGYALATLASDGVEDAYHDVRDLGGMTALETGAHPGLSTLRQAIDGFTASGGRRCSKIALDGMRPPIWRRVLVCASATLGDLHRIIQVVLDWNDDHLHMFSTDCGRYADPYHELDDCEDENAVRLSQARPRIGARTGYLYDFGDSWKHTITLERIEQPETAPIDPVCVTGRGDARIEDWNPDSDESSTIPFDRDRLNQCLAALTGGHVVNWSAHMRR
jgi:pRiA4b ORF-3-like protein